MPADERKAAVRRLLLEKAILDELGKQYESERVRVATMFDAGDRETAQEAGELLGAVTMAKGAKTARVTDPEAFLDWFRENRPEEIEIVPAVERVRPATQAAFLKRAKSEGGAFDKRTGEEMPGVTVGVADPVLKTVPEESAHNLVSFFIGSLMHTLEVGSVESTVRRTVTRGTVEESHQLSDEEVASIKSHFGVGSTAADVDADPDPREGAPLGDLDAEEFLAALRETYDNEPQCPHGDHHAARLCRGCAECNP